MASTVELETSAKPKSNTLVFQQFDAVMTSVLSSIAHSAGVRVEELQVRQWFREARGDIPGSIEDHWWQWLRIAASGLGLHERVVDLSLQQAVNLARDGVALLTVIKHGNEIASLEIKQHKKKIQAKCTKPDGVTILNEPEAIAAIEAESVDGRVRWVVTDAVAYQTNLLPSGKPWRRFLNLIQAESSDIWIVVLFAFMAGLLSLATPIAVEALVNTDAFGRLLQPVVGLALLLFGFVGFRARMKALQTYVVEIIQRRMFARMATALSYRLPRVDHEALDAANGPELVNRFMDIVTVQKVIAHLLLDGVAIVMTTFFGMAVLAFYHPWFLGFDIMLFGMVVFGIVLLGRGAVRTAVEESKCKYQVVSWFEDTIHSQLGFKLGGAADFAADRSNFWTSAYLNARRGHFRILLRQILFVLFLQAVAATVLLGFGGWLVIQGQLSLGQLVAAELIVTAILSSLTKLGKHLEGFYDALAAVDKLGYLFDLPLEPTTGLIQIWPHGPIEIKLKDVNYVLREKAVFPNSLNCTFRSGAITAITGPSGSGKSILMDLLYGLRNPTSGHITLAGFEPREVRPETLREKVALVRADIFLTGTLAENIHLHRPQVETARLREVIAHVDLVEEIRLLPEGIHTEITQYGVPLTTSQQQQVLLARALVGLPSLLLVDGSFDLLPPETLEHIMKSLKNQEMTVLVATNRPDVMKYCDDKIELRPISSF